MPRRSVLALWLAVFGLVVVVFVAPAIVWVYRGSEEGREGRVAFSIGLGPNRDVWRLGVVDADAGGRLTVLPVPIDEVVEPSWSPDGTKIAYADSTGVKLVDTSGLVRVAAVWVGQRLPFLDTAWSPDGKRIAYDNGTDLGEDIYVVDANGGRGRLLIRDGAEPSWSPDGREIVFRDGYGDASGPLEQLFVMSIDGSQRRQLTRGPGSVGEAAWAPDGERIAFGGEDGVYVINSDGTGERLLAEGREPAWSPDGTHIAFVRSAGDFEFPKPEDSIWTMKADGSDQRRLWPRRGLCSCASPSWGR